jgi:hypothetical protein
MSKGRGHCITVENYFKAVIYLYNFQQYIIINDLNYDMQYPIKIDSKTNKNITLLQTKKKCQDSASDFTTLKYDSEQRK